MLYSKALYHILKPGTRVLSPDLFPPALLHDKAVGGGLLTLYQFTLCSGVTCALSYNHRCSYDNKI